MSFLSLVSAVPPIALIVLFVVIGIILFELFILFKKKKSKNGQEPLVNTTPIEGFGATTAAPQTAAAKIPETPLPSKEGPSPQSPQLAQEKPHKKGFHLSRRTILLAGATLLILIAIPITVFLVKQQQEVRSRADTVNNCCQDPTYVNAPCDGGGDSALSEAQWNQGWYDCNNRACGACQGAPSVCGNSQCEPGESANTCPSDCEGSPQDPGPGDTGGGDTGGGDTPDTGNCNPNEYCQRFCNDYGACFRTGWGGSCVDPGNTQGKGEYRYDKPEDPICMNPYDGPGSTACGLPGVTVQCDAAGCGMDGMGHVCMENGQYNSACVRAHQCGYVAPGDECNDGAGNGAGTQTCGELGYGAGVTCKDVDGTYRCVGTGGDTANPRYFIGCGTNGQHTGSGCQNCYNYVSGGFAGCFSEPYSCGAAPECYSQPPPGDDQPPPGQTQPPATQPPQVSGSCQAIKVYTVSGNTWTKVGQADLPNLRPGQEIKIAVAGTTSGSNYGSSGFDRGRIRVNGGAWQRTTSKNPNGEYYINFVIPNDVVNFTFEGEVHHAGLNQWL